MSAKTKQHKTTKQNKNKNKSKNKTKQNLDSLCVETHLGPNGSRLEQNAQARLKKHEHAGQLAYGNVTREKQL